MKLGSRLIVVAGLTAFAGACGSAGTPAPALSPSGEPFEEGIAPSENEHTQAAAIALIQAQQLEESDSERSAEFYQTALTAAERGMEMDPENPESYFQGGRAHLGLGNYEEADRLLTRAEELYPAFFVDIEPIRESYWVDSYNAAIQEISAGNLERAAELFEEAGAIYDGRPEAFLNLASVYAQLGNFDGAIESYRNAIETIRNADPDVIDEEIMMEWADHEEVALLNLAQLLSYTEQHGEAATAYSEYLEIVPGDISALSNRAAALMANGQTDEATAIYDELLARPNLTGPDYSAIGIGLFQAGAYERAAGAFEEAVQASPTSRDDVYNWVQTLFLAENWEALIPAAEQLVQVDTHNRDAYRMLAQGLVQTGDEQTAVARMQAMEALPFEIINTSLQLMGDDGAQLVGEIQNLQLAAGTPIHLRVTFLGRQGVPAATSDVELQAPAEGETTSFVAESMEGDIIGYSYEVVSP